MMELNVKCSVRMDINKFKKISDYLYEFPRQGDMLVPVRIYATEKILKEMDDKVLDQISNVACLPGIQRYAFCMPDGHWGYGFPIGGCAAFDEEKGIISPGGVGYDINCGVRLIRTNLTLDDVKPKLRELINTLFQKVPCGVGSSGVIQLNDKKFDEVMVEGAKWAVKNELGWKGDIEYCEDFGSISSANPLLISQRARDRGYNQLGTLGSGNHFLEIQYIDTIYDEQAAKIMGIEQKGQIVVMIHCGSRGFGHQVTSDWIRKLENIISRYKIKIKDRQLVCVPISSNEGKEYYQAMSAAANNAFCNRQIITHLVRKSFELVFNKNPEHMDMNLIYDCCHNIAKKEDHTINNKTKTVYVHRKGATRAYWPEHPDLPQKYKSIGQPVLIPGSMGTETYILRGTEKSKETFASVAHGAGRTMSRRAASKIWRSEELRKDLEAKGIIVKSKTRWGLAEEAPGAYKNVSDVIESIVKSGLCKTIARSQCLGTIKG